MLFLNVGEPAIFDVTAAWEFEDGFDTRDLVLGDVDNDGDLDILSVNILATEQSRLYRNESPVLEGIPIEPSGLGSWSEND